MMETFAEQLAQAIGKTFKPMTKIAEELGIPYRTIQDWRAGRHEPNAYTQRTVLEQIEKIKYAEIEERKGKRYNKLLGTKANVVLFDELVR